MLQFLVQKLIKSWKNIEEKERAYEGKIKLARKRNEGRAKSGGSGLSFRERTEVFRELHKFREDIPGMSKEKVMKMLHEFKVCFDL